MSIDPVTLTLIASGISAVGSIFKGHQEAKQAKAYGDYKSAVELQQANRERKVSAAEEEDFRRQQSRLYAQRRAAMGASGVQSGTGSSLLAAEDFAAESELQALRIRSGGQARAGRMEQQAGLTRLAGRNAASSAKQAGYARAGSSLLTGFTTAYGRK